MSTPRDESGYGSVPIPDPTRLTTEALLREILALRELLLAKMETSDTKMTGHFLIDAQRFAKIDEQFHTIEAQRVEQKKDTQDALTAALTAQKEAVGKQDEANQKAISKSEQATKETLVSLQNLFRTTADAQGEKIDDVKTRVSQVESVKHGAAETKVGFLSNANLVLAAASVIVAVIVAIALYARHGTSVPATPTVVCTASYHPAPCP